MKNLYLKPLLMTGLMLPSLAMAAGLSANSKDQLEKMLAKQSSLNQQQNQTRGVSVKPVSLQSIEEALVKVGGKATVDFGDKNSKFSAVLIGSGADAVGDLAATSNASTGGPVIVRPPRVPRGHLMLVGKLGPDQSPDFCAFLIVTDAQGKIVPGKSAVKWNTCGQVGSPLRLKPGKYIVNFSGTFGTFDLSDMENKIIPLSEVLIPRDDGSIKFYAHRESCSLIELIKTATGQTAIIGDKKTVEETTQYFLDRKLKQPSWNCSKDTPMENDTYFFAGNDGDSFAVLPGVYYIAWKIDGSLYYTRNITVE